MRNEAMPGGEGLRELGLTSIQSYYSDMYKHMFILIEMILPVARLYSVLAAVRCLIIIHKNNYHKISGSALINIKTSCLGPVGPQHIPPHSYKL